MSSSATADAPRPDTAVEVVHAPAEWLLERALTLTLGALALLVVVGGAVAWSVRVSRVVRANGVLEQPEVWAVRSHDGGTVREVLVRTGQRVGRGDVVARLDDGDLSDAARAARLRLDESADTRASLSRLRPLDVATFHERARAAASAAEAARLRLATALVENGFPPNVDSVMVTPPSRIHVGVGLAREAALQAEAEERIARMAAERASQDSGELRRQEMSARRARDELLALERRRSWTGLIAPESGVVLTDGLERQIGRALRAGETLLEIGASAGWTARLFVSEHDIAAIRSGQRVELELRTVGRMTPIRTEGVVMAVSPQPWKGADEADQQNGAASVRGSSVYLTTVRVRDSGPFTTRDSVARRGMSVTARIATGRGRLGAVIVERLFGSGSEE